MVFQFPATNNLKNALQCWRQLLLLKAVHPLVLAIDHLYFHVCLCVCTFVCLCFFLMNCFCVHVGLHVCTSFFNWFCLCVLNYAQVFVYTCVHIYAQLPATPTYTMNCLAIIMFFCKII